MRGVCQRHSLQGVYTVDWVGIDAVALANLQVATDREETEARQLYRAVAQLRGEVLLEGGEIFDRWRPRIQRDEFLLSARNLAHYLALRRHDLRELQLQLMPWGLSSLGRCEARVIPNLNAVAAALSAMGSISGGPPPEPDSAGFFRGNDLLRQHSEAALGPSPANRGVRIMVTLPTEAAYDYEIVRRLVSRGMDIARINCAHDDGGVWAAMAEHVRRASAETGRPCRVCLDLCGPRSRIVSTTVPYDSRVRVGDLVLMTARPVPIDAEWCHQLQCSIPEVLDQLENGAQVWVNEGRLGAAVERRVNDGVLLRVTEAREKGEHLRQDKGLNFPDTDLRIDPLTPQDLRDLDVVAPLADLVGYSFVQLPVDIASLQRELAARGAGRVSLVAKIETRQAVKNLPELIVQGAGIQPLAIMIARGDLAVEVGYKRMAEIQEELLWLCEAAHVPVIWATQVLDNFVKKGVRHRAEMTDAAMAERAEGVMLNKGAFAAEAVTMLDDLLGRMEGHQFKKTSRMRALRTWTAEEPAGRPAAAAVERHDDDFASPQLSFLGHLPVTRSAVAFALERHLGQRRAGDEAPFVLHPLEVASMLDRSHYPDHVVASAVLHDVLEDTDTAASEVRRRFGPEVSELVSLVSDDLSIADKEERREDVRQRVRRAGGYAAVVYAADKVSKVRELRTMLARGLTEEPKGRLEHYRRSLAMLDEVIPNSRLVELLRFELEALDKLPPGGPEVPA
jgi:pyruvate kinase